MLNGYNIKNKKNKEENEMALKQWCGRKCSKCRGCKLDERIPCSPDCENLTEDGKIKVKACLESGCEEVKYVLHEEGLSDEEIFAKFGEVTEYPYMDLPDSVLTKTLNVTVDCQAVSKFLTICHERKR